LREIQSQGTKKKGKQNAYLLNDSTLVMTSGEIIKINDLLDVGRHITNELKLNIGLQEGASDLIEAFVENFLIDDRRIAHLLESTGNAPP